MTAALVAVRVRGREPEVVLPQPGQRVAVLFDAFGVSGAVAGVVASARYDRDGWSGSKIRFEDGSDVEGFDWWREIPKRPREGLAARLAALKRTDVPRLTYERLERTVEFVTHPVTEADVRMIDAYLRAFAWLPDADGVLLCPGCLTQGWTVGRATHACSCGWPGVRGHLIADQSDEAACARCGEPHHGHVAVEKVIGLGLTRVDYLCPEVGRGAATFKAPVLLELEQTLWAHPYDVKIGR